MSSLRGSAQRRSDELRLAAAQSATQAARRMAASRALGTAVVAVLTRLALSPIGNEFGIADGLPSLPTIFTGVAVLGAATAVLLAWAQWHRARTMASITLAFTIAAFILTLPVAPLVSGIVIAWSLYGFGRILFDARAADPFDAGSRELDAANRWLRGDGPAIRHQISVSVVAGISAVGYGFELDPAVFAMSAVFQVATIIGAYPFLVARLRQRDWLARIVLVLAAAGLATISNAWLSLTLLVFAQLLLLLSMARTAHWTRDVLQGLYERPAVLLTSSFVALILVGTLVLSFPVSSANGASIGLTDALFTATSASCVTGLIVLDTATAFSAFGQAVILILLQIGGLNIMVLSTFAALLLGRGLGLRGERALGDILDIGSPGAARRLIGFIVIATLGTEAVGAAGMTFVYLSNGFEPLRAIGYGIFHAISAFCNAGFALHTDSLTMFQNQPLPLLLIAALIVSGGLGFAVMGSLWQRSRRLGAGQLAVQSRIVIFTTATLIMVGMIAFLVGEWNTTLDGIGLTDKLANALFQSVTLRTAGFNTVALENMRSVTVLWMLVFMFIGASPGSTGGGIKTTTAVVLFAAIPAFIRRRHQIVIGGRSLSATVVHQSASIAVASTLVVLSGAILLMASQSLTFEQVVFEAFSAVGTVGLSIGATAQLDVFGKVVVVLLMLVGRVGPLAITLLLARDDPSRVSYPEARLMVG